jgi:hypothetical protein
MIKRLAFVLLTLGVSSLGIAFASDVGSSADVAGVRAAFQHKNPHFNTSGIHVDGNYALVNWYSQDASGFAAYKRASGERWQQFYFSGGATGIEDLTQHHVPASVARTLCAGWGSNSPC